jgi:SOS-response transcriptional repressor LexA
MDIESVLARIEGRLKAVGLSAHAASLAAGRPDAIRNLKRAFKNHDRRGVTTETLLALAPVLKTTAAWLLDGGEQTSGNLVPVLGRIGTGAEIQPEFEQVPPEGLYAIELPFLVPENAMALQVDGDDMWPRYNSGDAIICWRQGDLVQEVVGWEAVVRTASGKCYLKRIQHGATSGTFDLETHNAAPIRGIRLDRAWAIKAVVRSGQWRRR